MICTPPRLCLDCFLESARTDRTQGNRVPPRGGRSSHLPPATPIQRESGAGSSVDTASQLPGPAASVVAMTAPLHTSVRGAVIGVPGGSAPFA